MNTKKIVGSICLILGVIAICFSLYAMNRISHVKSEVNTATKPMSRSKKGKAANKYVQKEVSQYDTTVKVLLVGGIALFVIGGITFVLGKKRRDM